MIDTLTILALDLAWSGPTGWVIFQHPTPDPFISYGEIKPSSYWKEGTPRVQEIGLCLFNAVQRLAGGVDVVVYEQTDWHQGLEDRDDWQEAYARERQVQMTLSRAEMAVLLACGLARVKVHSIGANEAKAAANSYDKNEVAYYLSGLYPTRLDYVMNAEAQHWLSQKRLSKKKPRLSPGASFLRDRRDGSRITHNVSDAMNLADVAARLLLLEERVAEAGS